MADARPRDGKQPAARRRRFEKALKGRIGEKAEHGALAVARDFGELVHDVAHAFGADRGEQHAKIVDAEIVVDDPGRNNFAIGENLLDDYSLDALRSLVGL